MPLPDIFEFAGTNVTQRKFQQAQAKLLNFVGELDIRQAATANGYFKSYATLADANADIGNIPFGTSIKVLNSSEGGEYYKATAGSTSLTKSQYDPVQQANQYAEQVSEKIFNDGIANFAEQKKDEDLIQFEDKEGRVFARIDGESNLHLEGLEGSVQEEIIHIAQRTNSYDEDQDLEKKYDAEGNLYQRVDKKGDLYLPSLSGSVQDNINKILGGFEDDKVFSSPKSYRTSADLVCSEALSSLSFLKLSNVATCIPPQNLVPQQYHIGKSWIQTVNANLSNERIVIGAFNDSGSATNWSADSPVVHPYLINFNQQVAGYKYWLGVTPYYQTSEDFELPYIYGCNSDDLDDWHLIDGFPKPFEADPANEDGSTSGHLSDDFFTYDSSTGELYFCWRKTLYFNGGRDRKVAKNALCARKTSDGQNWSDVFEIYPKFTDISYNLLLSPAILFNPKTNLFHIYHVNAYGEVCHQTSPSLVQPRWSDIEIVTGLEGLTAWHLEAKYVGDAVVLLIHVDTVDRLYFAVSYNFKDFECGGSVLNGETSLYKSTFIPMFSDNNEMKLKIIYTTDQYVSPQWQLHLTETNFISIED